MRLAIVLLTAALLVGCSAKIPSAPPCAPPVVWLLDVPEPVLGGRTNNDLAELVIRLQEALRLSNLDKFHLRECLSDRAETP